MNTQTITKPNGASARSIAARLAMIGTQHGSYPADQAELIASLRQVIADMEDRGGIDWEQRRWDAASRNMAALLGLPNQSKVNRFNDAANRSILAADALIAALKGETK